MCIFIGFPTETSDERFRLVPEKVTPNSENRNHNKTHHHHNNQFKPKSTTIPTISIGMVHDHRMIVMQDFEDKEQEILNLINSVGFDEAVNIFEGRVLLSLKTPPTAEDRAIVREAVMKALFDHNLLREYDTTPGSNSQQRFSNSNVRKNKRKHATTKKPLVMITKPHSPLALKPLMTTTTTLRYQDVLSAENDDNGGPTLSSKMTTTLKSQDDDNESSDSDN